MCLYVRKHTYNNILYMCICIYTCVSLYVYIRVCMYVSVHMYMHVKMIMHEAHTHIQYYLFLNHPNESSIPDIYSLSH